MVARGLALLGATTLAVAALSAITTWTAPNASATLWRLQVDHEDTMSPGQYGLLVQVGGDPATDSTPVWFLDNGKPIAGSPTKPYVTGGSTGPCPVSNTKTCFGWIGWIPKTYGVHHLVAEQRAADGSVLSSAATDFDVQVLSVGSASVPSGSFGS